MELDYISIGTKIRAYRKAKGITQQKLAEISCQEPSNISHIERGATKLSLPTLVSIANALGVTADEIICDSVEASKVPYEKEVSSILSSCTHDERVIITETMKTLKKSLQSSRK